LLSFVVCCSLGTFDADSVGFVVNFWKSIPHPQSSAYKERREVS
jgi:hypothetical protein